MIRNEVFIKFINFFIIARIKDALATAKEMAYRVFHIASFGKMQAVVAFLVIGAFAASPVFAQRSKADKMFDNKQYYEAAQLYEAAVRGKGADLSFIRERIGMCYLKIGRPQESLPWLRLLVDGGEASGEAWFLYGSALQQIGDYRKAADAFGRCLKVQADHPLAAVKIASCRFALLNNEVNPYADFQPALGVNTGGGEYGISLFTGGMVYYSAAGAPAEGANTDRQTGLQYPESYMARLSGGKLVHVQPVDDALPPVVAEGLFAYDSIARRVYFSYCDPVDGRCGIYSSRPENTARNLPEPVLLNRRNRVTDHPALANGGTRLYFASNSSDGIGQTDILYMDRNEDGKWGQPVNAGNVVNTPGREEYPFVYADTLLFFASDGHVGYGGLDIFCSVIKGNTFGAPVNLRRPYNSHGDDFNMVIRGNTGMMSSSRNESMRDDIYMFTGLPSLLYVSGNITDAGAGGAPVGGARITLSVDGKPLRNITSDSTGYYGFFLKGNESSPMMYVRKTGCKLVLTDVTVGEITQFTDVRKNVALQRSTVLPVTVSLYDKVTEKPVIERGVICYNNDGETQIMRTDAEGKFRFSRQEDQKEYWIKFPDGYYLTESVILSEEQTTYSLGVQPLSGELFSGWLRFKRGSTELVEMSQPLVPHVAAVMKANPGVVFRITGFGDTDSEAMQPDLAGQRADYIMRRMVEEGVDERQLAAVAGKNRAKPTGKTTEEQHAAQRKVEIKVKK